MPTHWESNSEPIPGYRLIERLGRGGFGEVWKAEAPGGLTKAIKFVFGTIKAEGSGDRNHADQELKALSRVRGIRHPFILSMERFDIIDDQLIIVMELADRNMEERMRECHKQGLPGIPRAELLKYLSEAAEALDLMNSEHDLQHLDIKPSNLFLVGSHVKVADFGLVKDLEGRSAQVTGGVTPVYAAPETFDGWVSRNTDQYSLAIVYQELLTGHRPFTGPSARQYMMQHLTSLPDVTALPECDRSIIHRALSKDPDKRFASCTEMVEAIASAGFGQPTTKTVPLAPPPSPGLDLAGPTPVAQEEFSTQLSQPSSSGSALHASRRSGPILQKITVEASPDGTLCPALIVGVGRTGIRCLERIRAKLKARFGEQRSWPAVRLLALDSDSNAIREIERTEAVSKETHNEILSCLIRKPTQYLQQWDRLKHLSSWLDPNFLFQLSSAGTTNGYRALGRLAFIDNYRRVESRLQTELYELTAPANIEAALTATGQKLRQTIPRVYVIANMGGGTGSGMFIDLCYLVRRLLLEMGASTPDVQGILVAEKPPQNRDEELRRTNQYALAQDLLNLTQPDAEFSISYDSEGGSDRFTGPPIEAAYLFDASAEHLPDPKDEVVLDTISELLYHSIADAFGRHLDNAGGAWPRFRTAGWFSLIYPRRAVLRQVASRLCHAMVHEWVQPVSTKRCDEWTRAAEQSIGTAGFDPARIATQLLEACNQELPEPIHVMAARRLAALDEAMLKTEYAKHGQLRDHAIEDLKQLLGLDPNEEEGSFATQPLLDQVIFKATNTVASNLLAPLSRALAQALDEPGNRIERARRTIDGFSQYLMRMVDQQQEHVRTAQIAVNRRARDLRGERGGIGQAASAVLKGGITSTLERYAKEKIDCRLREQVSQVFLVLRGKLSDKSRELVSIRQVLDHISDALQKEKEVVDDVGGYSAQTLFPGGLLLLTDAVAEIFEPLKESRIGAMELKIQQSALLPLGGLWAACTAGEEMSKTIAGAMISKAMTWVQEMMVSADVADAFFDRHRADPAGQANELRAFFEWAAPSMVGRPTKGAADDPVGESFFLSVPDSPAGAFLAQSLQQVVREPKPILITGGEQAILSRIQMHSSLARLLPLWILESRRLFDQARQGRLTPEIFPQFARR